METERENDKRSRKIGFIASLIVHGAIALMLFLMVAWRAPDPPNPEFGIEINLGFSDIGGGDVQPETETGDAGQSEESAAQPAEALPQEEIKDESTEEKQQEDVVTDESNPVSVKEEPKEVKEETKKEPVKEVVKTIPKEEAKVVKEEAVFTPIEATDKTATQKKGEAASQGNDKNAKGDKGQPDGTLNKDAEYTGISGRGDRGTGTGLELAGWRWENKPSFELPGETGRLVFEIEVDENGEIIKLVALERGLSPQAEKKCRDEILKLNLLPNGEKTPTISKGKITIVVKAQ